MVIISLEIKRVDGCSIASHLIKNKPNVLIVFLAENTNKIQRAFELGVFRFLLYPLRKDEFYCCLNDALEKLRDEYVMVYGDNAKEIIKLKDILYIEAGVKGTIVRNLTTIYYRKYNLANWEANTVNHPFYRCHKSYIVNLSYVDKICKEYAELHNGERVMISRRRQKKFELRLNKHIGGGSGNIYA